MQPLTPTSRQWHDRPRAFTLVELLVTITLIFIIITVAFMAFRTIRRGAERTVSLNALRQIMVGYNAYADAHKNRLMPGHVDPDHVGVLSGDIVPFAKLPNGRPMSAEDSAPYAWRLAPYLDHAWKAYMADYRSSAMEARLETEYGAGAYGPGTAGASQLGIASAVSFGLNSIFMGGNEVHGGPSLTALSPWSWDSSGHVINNPDKIAATRGSEVKMPSKLIVFGAARATDPPASSDPTIVIGYPELRPPYPLYDPKAGTLGPPQWTINATSGEIDVSGMATPGGIPFDRLGQSKVPVGHFDGSVDNYNPLEAQITANPGQAEISLRMARWCPFAFYPG